MFSFLKFLNSKSDDVKNKASNSLSGKTFNRNNAEARALSVFNNKSPIARKPNGNSTLSSNNCRETVTSPGFSFRIAQKAREMRSTTPNVDMSSLSTSYTLENSLNGSNTINGNNTTPRDVYDKKRKLMETLDNFGVKKRIRQESGVDAFVNRRRRTISESNAPDRIAVMNGYNHRLPQPTSTVMSPKNANVENKKTKRYGDFESSSCHIQKKPRTRNNEILSSYSSSKFLLRPGQKRPYPTDHESESPSRKHCKSCTCCGSTVILENDQNNHNKSDKTTETDLSDDLVTVAASRIFNRSGKTQVVRKMCMKTVLDEVFDDVDPVPYTSIEKVQEKKKKVISIIDKSNVDGHSVDSVVSNSSTITSKFNETQPVVTSILSIAPSSTASISSVPLITTTPLVQPTPSLTFGFQPSENKPKVDDGNPNKTPLQLNFGSPTVSAASSNEGTHIQTNEVDGKVTDNSTPESTNVTFTFITPTTKSGVKNSNVQHKLFQSPEEKGNIINDKSQIGGLSDSKSDKDKSSFQFTEPASKPSEPLINSSTFSDSSKKNEKSVLELQFSSPENAAKQPAFTFGVPKADEKQSTPVMQFGSPKVDSKQSTSIMQFGNPKVDNKQSTPVMQFGSPKVDDKKSTPVMQFGASKDDDKHSSPVIQFGIPKVNDKQSTPSLLFGTTKESESKTSTQPLFSFGNNQKPNDQSTEPVKFQFGSSKPDNVSVPTSTTEPKNVVFASNNLQNQNLFSFGKSDNMSTPTGNPPKYDATIEKSTPKLQFAALPTSPFGTSNIDQLKPQFGTSVGQSIDNQGPKLVFGSQSSENKPMTSASGSMLFANNLSNPIFQFNSSSSKKNDKASEVPSSSFPFSSNKTPIFGATALQNFGDKPAYQFNTQKTEESKTNQFLTPTFGPQSTNAPFKFGGNNKPASFGSSTFSTSNQPLQFTNNSEKPVGPFKFGSTVSSGNTFQFNSNKTDNNQVKFGQTSNTFSTTPGFNGFGSAAPQQATTFGSVPSSQSSPFGNITSPSAAPTFGSVVASSTSNSFGTNQGFQFGGSNNPSSSSTFAFGSNAQPAKPDGAFSFNAAPTTAVTSPFQFGQASSPQFRAPTSQGAAFSFGSPSMTTNAMPGSSQPLFSMGTAPAVERRKVKAVRRRQ